MVLHITICRDISLNLARGFGTWPAYFVLMLTLAQLDRLNCRRAGSAVGEGKNFQYERGLQETVNRPRMVLYITICRDIPLTLARGFGNAFGPVGHNVEGIW